MLTLFRYTVTARIPGEEFGPTRLLSLQAEQGVHVPRGDACGSARSYRDLDEQVFGNYILPKLPLLNARKDTKVMVARSLITSHLLVDEWIVDEEEEGISDVDQ